MNYRISKRQPSQAGNFFKLLVKSLGRENELVQNCVFTAWDEIVPLKDVTSYKMLKEGTLVVKINSSVAKSELMLCRASLLLSIQDALKGNKLLLDAGIETEGLVKSIVLK